MPRVIFAGGTGPKGLFSINRIPFAQCRILFRRLKKYFGTAICGPISRHLIPPPPSVSCNLFCEYAPSGMSRKSNRTSSRSSCPRLPSRNIPASDFPEAGIPVKRGCTWRASTLQTLGFPHIAAQAGLLVFQQSRFARAG
jgi:hypothetical protein